MAYTLVDVVNKVMRRARLINSTDEQLTDFTDNTLRVDVDMVVDAVNDTIRDVMDHCEFTPFGTAESFITIVDGQREYAMPSNFLIMSSDTLLDKANGHRIPEYRNGYEGMFSDQNIPSQYIGQPNFWAINPSTGELRLDVAPTAEYAGDEYHFVHTTQLNYEAYDDVIALPDMVIRDLIPAFVQMYRRDSDPTTYDGQTYLRAASLAVAALKHQKVQTQYYAQT